MAECSYSAAIRAVRQVVYFRWPHDHVVYPRNFYRPCLNTPELRKGRKQLKRVLGYLENQARIEREA